MIMLPKLICQLITRDILIKKVVMLNSKRKRILK